MIPNSDGVLLLEFRPLWPRWRGLTPPSLLAALALAVFIDTASAQPVDCSNPDNLCTGNPCTTGELELPAVCTVDFGARTLIIGDKIEIPDAGQVEFTADEIEVRGTMAGSNPNGSQVSLIAAQDILLKRRINTSGKLTPGSVLLDAGGNISLESRLISRSKGGGATATGGIVTIQAGGTLTTLRRAKIDIRGKRQQTTGGTANLSGDAGVTFLGQIDVRGSAGGVIIIASSSGNVALEHKVRAAGRPGDGGNVTVSAGGAAVTQGKATINVRGTANGGMANISGNAGVTLRRPVIAKGTLGGTVIITSTSGDIVVEKKIETRAKTTGGMVIIASTSGDIVLEKSIDVRGNTQGGEVRVESTVGNITFGIGGKTKFRATGDAGGVIEGQAGGNLTAAGKFTAAGGGCVGLSAGGTLDTSLSTFDVPLTASCP